MAERTDTVRKLAAQRTRMPTLVALPLSAALCWCALPAHSDPLPNDYPTTARVEFVQDCMGRHGGKLEASTFAHYSTLPGEGGGIFRDPDRAKERAKLYRTLEANAYKACGLPPPGGGGK
jgi:hypothetical protein